MDPRPMPYAAQSSAPYLYSNTSSAPPFISFNYSSHPNIDAHRSNSTSFRPALAHANHSPSKPHQNWSEHTLDFRHSYELGGNFHGAQAPDPLIDAHGPLQGSELKKCTLQDFSAPGPCFACTNPSLQAGFNNERPLNSLSTLNPTILPTPTQHNTMRAFNTPHNTLPQTLSLPNSQASVQQAHLCDQSEECDLLNRLDPALLSQLLTAVLDEKKMALLESESVHAWISSQQQRLGEQHRVLNANVASLSAPAIGTQPRNGPLIPTAPYVCRPPHLPNLCPPISSEAPPLSDPRWSLSHSRLSSMF